MKTVFNHPSCPIFNITSLGYHADNVLTEVRTHSDYQGKATLHAERGRAVLHKSAVTLFDTSGEGQVVTVKLLVPEFFI